MTDHDCQERGWSMTGKGRFASREAMLNLLEAIADAISDIPGMISVYVDPLDDPPIASRKASLTPAAVELLRVFSEKERLRPPVVDEYAPANLDGEAA